MEATPAKQTAGLPAFPRGQDASAFGTVQAAPQSGLICFSCGKIRTNTDLFRRLS